MGALAQMVSELAAVHLKQLEEVHAWSKQQTEVLENLITCSGSLLTGGGPGGSYEPPRNSKGTLPTLDGPS